ERIGQVRIGVGVPEYPHRSAPGRFAPGRLPAMARRPRGERSERSHLHAPGPRHSEDRTRGDRWKDDGGGVADTGPRSIGRREIRGRVMTIEPRASDLNYSLRRYFVDRYQAETIGSWTAG